ncbi:MAG: hypothetical protein O9310_10635 [Leptospiraceae bacterium]|nr:hypothetical protein [Leptospiraceae bacterium]
MLSSAATLADPCSLYHAVEGRIVLPTACDWTFATFAFGQEAQWRNGKDNRPHLYVEGNPVGFRDPSGNNAIIGQLNAIMKHMMGSIKIGDKIGRSIGRGLDYSMRKAGRGIDGAARQLASGGKYSRNKGNDLDHFLGTGQTYPLNETIS